MRAYSKVLASLGMAAIVGASLPLAAAALTPTLGFPSADVVVLGSGGPTDPTDGGQGGDPDGGDEGGHSGTGDGSGPVGPTPPDTQVNGGATCCTY